MHFQPTLAHFLLLVLFFPPLSLAQFSVFVRNTHLVLQILWTEFAIAFPVNNLIFPCDLQGVNCVQFSLCKRQIYCFCFMSFFIFFGLFCWVFICFVFAVVSFLDSFLH